MLLVARSLCSFAGFFLFPFLPCGDEVILHVHRQEFALPFFGQSSLSLHPRRTAFALRRHAWCHVEEHACSPAYVVPLAFVLTRGLTVRGIRSMVAREGPFLLQMHQEFVQFGVRIFHLYFRVLFEYCFLVCSQCTPRLVARC